MSLLNLIKSRFEGILSSMAEDTGPLLEMIRPAQDPRFGDFQVNCAMSLGRQLGRPPRDVAQQIADGVSIDDICETPDVAGPGFINLRLRDEFVAARVSAMAADDRLAVEPAVTPRHVVVDFSSPNVAKPMHVGHLRSTVIGDAICRTLKFAGHKVTSDNHIGDWGTQFGMIIYGYRHFLDADAYAADAVGELARLYKLVNQISDYHAAAAGLPKLKESAAAISQQLEQARTEPAEDQKKAKKQIQQLQRQLETANEAVESAEAKIRTVDNDPTLHQLALPHADIARLAREETAKLHAGDAQNQKLWDEFLPACMQALQKIYDRLGIRFDLSLGESFYNPMLADVVTDLMQRQLATESEGARCVFIEGNRAPFIVQKSDGAYTYATTDLATIRYRQQILMADELLYVVDKRQSEHFQLLFRTAELWNGDGLKMQHISFGTVMGSDGKPYKTRSGDTVGLESLIDEAISRARVIVDENDDNRKGGRVLTDQQRERVAEIVGIGGIKYADLHHNRDSDYIFDWDKMLAMTGDTAAYMQYAFARICGIFRRLQVDRSSVRSEPTVLLTSPEERALAIQLLQFDYAIESVLSEYRPHLLTAWLFETADKFSRFYDRCSVQDAETDALRRSRLILCDLMARALQTGLSLLGIETAEVM